MTSDPDDVADAQLQGLQREMASSYELEDRVVAALRQSGHIRSRPRTAGIWFAAVAAGCFAAGWFGHGITARRGAAPNDRPLYLFLFSQVRSSAIPPGVSLLREMNAWAGTVRRNHQLVHAERLSSQFELVRTTADVAPLGGDIQSGPSGFFLVRADSMLEAVTLAQACPMLRYGASVTVHAVDTPSEVVQDLGLLRTPLR